ncbi:MAG: family 10 glycosylhydrolase [Armatimonadetes bacterium]|nr:family 10 glycosylhydrolase [Armatimonadota bacterium]
MLKWILILLTLAVPTTAEIDYTKLDLPVELRAIWINADAIPRTDKGIRDLVRAYRKANLNLLLPEVVARGYTVYPSKLIARDPRFAEAIDPLPPMIDEAHKLGMEVHPWVWVFRAGYAGDRGAILTAHPDWAELGKNGRELSPNGGLWISPSVPAARDFLACLFAELVSNYNVDGLHLDYVRYEVESPIPYGYCDTSRETFKRQYGIDPMDIDRLSFNQIEWMKFRERQINTFVQRIALQTRSIKPWVKISAAVGSDPGIARLNLMQNWGNWAANKWVTFVTPMAYTSNDQTFERLVAADRSGVDNKVIIAPGIGLHMQQNAPDQTVRQIGIARKNMADGQALFASSHYKVPLESELIEGPYARPASLPFRCTSEALAKAGKCAGETELGEYYRARAANLLDFEAYQAAAIPYIPPTKLPLKLPEYVVPLPSVAVPKASSRITIDGSLNDAAWQSAAKVELGYTPTGEPAPVKTAAMLTYDDESLYIAFECFEPDMSKIKAMVTKRDGPTFYDDSVEVFIDPTGKRADYYHLSTNTLGTRFDQKVFNVTWNGDWATASKLDTTGWTTEIAVPFTILGAPLPTLGDTWAVNLTRNRTTSGVVEYLTWAVPYGSFHSPDRFGSLRF